MEKISRFVTKRPILIIVLSLILLLPSLVGYVFTEVNYNILSYLPEKLDSVKGQHVLTDVYDIESTTMVIVEDMQPKKVVQLKNKISEIDNVASVLWYDDLIDTSIPSDILPDEIRNVFYSKDGNYTMMFVSYTPECSSKDIVKAVKEIKSQTQKYCLLSGLTPINVDTQELTNVELPIYIALAVVFILVIMLLTMDSFIQPFIVLFVLGSSVLYNMGSNWLVGGISYITQCIAAILQLAVTMDYSIFVVNRYKEEKLKSVTKEEAMQRTLKASVTSLMGSSLTTVFGFLALCFMQLALGFNLGIIMAKGVVIGLLSAVLILPAYLLVFDKAVSKKSHKTFVPKFDKLIDFSVKHRKVFVIIFVILFIPSVFLAANVNQYYNIASTLPEDLDSVVALNTLKEEFNMTTTHFIIVDDSISAEKLLEMENRIDDLDGVTSMLAYNQFVGTSVPDSIIPDGVTDIIKQGGYQIMLVNSAYEAATEPANEQVSTMYSIVKEYDPEGYITGEGAMYSDMVDITVTDFTITNIISILAVFVIIAFIFKSFALPVILIFSIELAILLNESISAILGTPISFVAPTIISCVQLGATVDYAILLTSRFREELKDGKDKFKAMKKAASESLQSVFQSATIFFLVTISVYFVSSISIVKEICELLARGSIISALIIVFVLTPLLLISEKFIFKTTKNWGPDKSAVNDRDFTVQTPFIQNPDNGMLSYVNDCEENSNENF